MWSWIGNKEPLAPKGGQEKNPWPLPIDRDKWRGTR